MNVNGSIDLEGVQLAIDLREGKHVGNIKWRVIPLYVEVGCQGTVNQRPWYYYKHDMG